MSLKERLEAISRKSAKQADDATKSDMRQAMEQLHASGIADRALGDGGKAPAFALPNSSGEPVRLHRLLGQGPLVLTFFRGHW